MFKKVLTAILCLSITVPTFAQQPTPQHKEEPTPILDRLVIPSLAVSLICLHLVTAPDAVRERFINQLAPGKLALNFIKHYTTTTLATLAHEGGHAAMRKLLTGISSVIHLGTNEPCKEPLLNLGPIHIDSLTPGLGVTEADRKKEFEAYINNYKASKPEIGNRQLTADELVQLLRSKEFADFQNSLCSNKQKLLITAVGPICGLIANLAMQATTAGTLSLDQVAIKQLLNLLIPCNEKSDAAILWRDGLGVPEHVIKAVYTEDPIIHQFSMASIINICFEVYLAVKDAQDEENTPMHSKVLVGLINYVLQGYLRFKA